MMKTYQGIKTKQTIDNKTTIYYEKAYDRNSKGLHIGDRVRVVGHDGTQQDLRGLVMYITGIFQGDLMLAQKRNGDPYFYCWPYKVESLKD